MSVLNGLQSGEVVALGWTLLHFCWQSTAIALVYAALDRCAVRTPGSVRYGIAFVALALLPLVAAATFVEQMRLVSNVAIGQQQGTVSQLETIHAALAENMPPVVPAIGSSGLWIAQHAGLLLPSMDVLWLVGVLWFALRAAGGWWQLSTLRRTAKVAAPPELRSAFDYLALRYRLGHRVVLRVSDEVISPMVFGIWRAVVLMPLSATISLTPEQLQAILAHELAHIRRWDYLCNLLQTSIECLFFFQPAVWWISRRVREFREACCDQVAATTCADPIVYAEALLHMEEQRVQHRRLAVALQGNGGPLLNRIRRVLGEEAMDHRSMSGIRIAVVSMVLAGLYVAPHIAHGMKGQPTQAEAAPVPAATTNNDTASPVVAANPEPAPRPVAAVAPEPAPEPAPASAPNTVEVPAPTSPPEPMAAQASSGQSGTGYLQKMRDAGYPLDLNKDLDEIVRLRSVGVTGDYAKSMAQVGLGVPTLHDLVTLRAIGVTPEYVASLQGTAIAPSNFHDVITAKSLGITPEFAKSVESLGFGKVSAHEVVAIKSVGVTPEYIAALKASGFAPANLHEAISMKSVGVTPEYASAMAAAGFSAANAHELISMRAQGVTPEYAKWLKGTFPDADSHALRQASVFHIDPEFLAKAKANGFNSTSLEKLNKLKISGVLD
jgi:beta-lactamase regulating signal transducer with metallopeptidase domain